MLGSAGSRIRAQLGAKGIWEGATCSGAQGAMKGTHTVHGGEGCAWGRTAWGPHSPSAAPAATQPLCPAPPGPLSPCPKGTAAAEPQPSRSRGKGAVAEQVSLQ